MRLLSDVGALFAILLLVYLFYLILFERWAVYRTSGPVHQLDDQQRLQLLTSVLGTPVQTVASARNPP